MAEKEVKVQILITIDEEDYEKMDAMGGISTFIDAELGNHFASAMVTGCEEGEWTYEEDDDFEEDEFTEEELEF